MNLPPLQLTKTVAADLEDFFAFQLDEEANYLAAFTAKDPNDKTAYITKYTAHMVDPNINMQTIRLEEEIVGSIARFMLGEDAGLTYWISKQYWGRGIATQALKIFLQMETIRPILAFTVFDNLGSQKVLLKNGFVKTGTDKGFANARQAEIEEYIFKLV